MPTSIQAPDVSFIKPRLRIFLSVDLIGSTQFKISQSYSDGPAKPHDDESWWPNVLMAFYTDFQKKFLENWDEFKSLAVNWSEIKIGEPPKLWKALGDELIFSKICIHENEVWALIQVWRKTLVDFKSTWKFDLLKFKSGAWVVGSPVRNWEVAFLRQPIDPIDLPLMDDRVAYNLHLLSQYYESENQKKIDLDFVGPSMDCGFRLLGKADERKMIVSADLVYLLRKSQAHCEAKFMDHYKPLKFYFDGVSELKGIDRYGVKYPIFWLDAFELSPESDVAKYAQSVDALADDNKPVADKKLKSFLDTYLSDMKGYPELPYITVSEGSAAAASAVPSDHYERIEKFQNAYLSALERLKSLEASAKDQGNDGSDPTDTQAEAISSVPIEP